MKKLIALLLTVSLMAAFVCTPALAARTGKDTPDTSSNIDVSIKLDASARVHKYCIDIEFGDMLFIYKVGGSTWDPETYTYTGGGADAWTPSTASTGDIRIINHSDMPVSYAIASQDVVNTYGSLAVNFTNASGTIDACKPGDADSSHYSQSKASVSGTPNHALTATQVTLGKIVVTIS